MALVGCSPYIGSMVRTMGLHRLFGLHADLETALAWLNLVPAAKGEVRAGG